MQGLAGGCLIFVARTTNTAARPGRFAIGGLFNRGSNALFLVVIRGADGGRKNGEVDLLIFYRGRTPTGLVSKTSIGSVTARFGTVAPAAVATGTVTNRTIAARLAVVARFTVGARTRLLLLTLRLIVLIAVIALTIGFHFRIQALVAVIVLVVVATSLLLVKPWPGIAEQAEIMVGELQIIFGLDTIAGKLGIARHALVLFV